MTSCISNAIRLMRFLIHVCESLSWVLIGCRTPDSTWLLIQRVKCHAFCRWHFTSVSWQDDCSVLIELLLMILIWLKEWALIQKEDIGKSYLPPTSADKVNSSHFFVVMLEKKRGLRVSGCWILFTKGKKPLNFFTQGNPIINYLYSKSALKSAVFSITTKQPLVPG